MVHISRLWLQDYQQARFASLLLMRMDQVVISIHNNMLIKDIQMVVQMAALNQDPHAFR